MFLALLLGLLGVGTWWPRRRVAGFGRWTTANLLVVMSMPLLALGEFGPDWLSVLGANLLLLFASILYLEGARQFRGVHPRLLYTYVAAGVALLGIAYFDFIKPSVNARIALMSLLMGTLGILCSFTLLKAAATRDRTGIRVSAIAFGISAAVLIGRAIYFVLSPASNSLFAPNWINGAFIMAASLALATCSVSLIVMTDEGVMMDLKEAEGRALKAGAEAEQSRQAEALLRESEARFRSMADTAAVMICVSGPDKHATFFNKGWLDFTGRTLDQELGYGWTEGVHPQDLDTCLAGYSASFDARQDCQLEYRLRRADGEYRWVICRGVPRYDPGAVFAGYIASAIDITEVKRAQEEALTRQKLESLGILTGGVAHDFNNLLGSVIAEAELAEMELAEGTSPLPEIHRIKTIALRASEIVRELMIYSGHDKAHFEAVNLSDVIDEMLELLKVSISKHAMLKVDLQHGLPEVRGNSSQIRQIVMNLIINASEAIGEGNGVITVTASRALQAPGLDAKGWPNVPAGEHLLLQVSDTGCGMTKDVQAKIFDPFFTTKFVGRGLGLAVVQGIVRTHGGAINLSSAPGKGTTIQIFFPCTHMSAQASIAAPVQSLNQHHASLGGTVLLVEDEERLRQSVSSMLRKKGFSVFEAGDGSAAIDILRAGTYSLDVMLLDITIPGVSSREVLEEVRLTQPGLRVILTSAYNRELAAQSLDAAHVQGFIRKPFHFSDLEQLLYSTLSASNPGLGTQSPGS